MRIGFHSSDSLSRIAKHYGLPESLVLAALKASKLISSHVSNLADVVGSFSLEMFVAELGEEESAKLSSFIDATHSAQFES